MDGQRAVSHAGWRALLQDGLLAGLWLDGAEVLRGLAHPARDPDWATWPEETLSETVEEEVGALCVRRRFLTAGGGLEGRFSLRLAPDGEARAELAMRALADLRLNRAGFMALHPIRDEAGADLRVEHPDGTATLTAFPTRISPAQPVRNVAALAYETPSLALRLAFKGDVFEMEDQRNWSDASFKTYCRPLARPRPYDVRQGTEWRQAVGISARRGSPARGAEPAAELAAIGEAGLMPRVALATEPGWGWRSGARHALWLDLRGTGGEWPRGVGPGAVEIEAVVGDEAAEAEAQLRALARRLDEAGLAATHVTALPAAYLRSHQPEGPWPAGLSPAIAVELTRRAFPGTAAGGGVLTNFAELNRPPDSLAQTDFVTYATTAIVHAADDGSVMQTPEALAQIHRSAAESHPGRPLRLGFLVIGMRSNPYGAATVPNPGRSRLAMAMDDPRHDGDFGAAFAVAAVAATEGTPVERLCLGAPDGPFALRRDGADTPLGAVWRRLAQAEGRPRLKTRHPDGVAAVLWRDPQGEATGLIANLGPAPRVLPLVPGRARLDLPGHAVRLLDGSAP